MQGSMQQTHPWQTVHSSSRDGCDALLVLLLHGILHQMVRQ